MSELLNRLALKWVFCWMTRDETNFQRVEFDQKLIQLIQSLKSYFVLGFLWFYHQNRKIKQKNMSSSIPDFMLGLGSNLGPLASDLSYHGSRSNKLWLSQVHQATRTQPMIEIFRRQILVALESCKFESQISIQLYFTRKRNQYPTTKTLMWKGASS